MWRKMVTDWHADTQTDMQHNDPASPRTGLGKKIYKIQNVSSQFYAITIPILVSRTSVILIFTSFKKQLFHTKLNFKFIDIMRVHSLLFSFTYINTCYMCMSPLTECSKKDIFR